MADPINELRRSILTDYAESVGLPKEARNYGGARPRPADTRHSRLTPAARPCNFCAN